MRFVALDLQRRLNQDWSAIVRADTVMAASTILAMGEGKQYATLRSMLELLDVPENGQQFVVKRWKPAGKPSMTKFLPYIFHVNSFFVWR